MSPSGSCDLLTGLRTVLEREEVLNSEGECEYQSVAFVCVGVMVHASRIFIQIQLVCI